MSLPKLVLGTEVKLVKTQLDEIVRGIRRNFSADANSTICRVIKRYLLASYKKDKARRVEKDMRGWRDLEDICEAVFGCLYVEADRVDRQLRDLFRYSLIYQRNVMNGRKVVFREYRYRFISGWYSTVKLQTR
jgi:hypothetical protein